MQSTELDAGDPVGPKGPQLCLLEHVEPLAQGLVHSEIQ